MKLTLRKDEKVIIMARRHWMFYFWPSVIAAVGFIMLFGNVPVEASLGVFLLGILLGVWRYIGDKTSELVLTNQRLNIRYGILSVTNTTITLAKVQDVQYRQSVAGRILGYGDIYVQTAAVGGLSWYRAVVNPESIKNAIDEVVAGRAG